MVLDAMMDHFVVSRNKTEHLIELYKEDVQSQRICKRLTGDKRESNSCPLVLPRS
jgi:hypothetical protein